MRICTAICVSHLLGKSQLLHPSKKLCMFITAYPKNRFAAQRRPVQFEDRYLTNRSNNGDSHNHVTITEFTSTSVGQNSLLLLLLLTT